MENPAQDNSNVDNGTADSNAAESSLMNTIDSVSAQESEPAVEPGNGDNTNGDNAGSDESSKEVQPPAWTQQLPEEMRNNKDVMAQLSKFAKIGDMARSYTELESKLGKTLVQPGENASTEEVQAFYEKLGKPSSADAYSITDENAQAMKELFFKNNLTDDQAKNLYGELKQIGVNAVKANREALEKTAAETEKNLKSKYGSEYGKKMEMFKRGVKTYGGQALLDQLKSSGLIAQQNIVEMYVLLGEQSSENSTPAGSASQAEQYKDTASGGHFSFKYD